MTRKPQTMDGVLALNAEDFREIDDWQYHGDPSPKYIIKDLVRILDDELEWQGREDSMSLRGLWYSGVKTALQNAFPEKWDDPDFDANRRYSQYLSEHLSDMVKDGEVTYRGLNIVDDSRQRDIAHGTIEDDKILFVEKEAAYRRLQPIQRVFEVSLVSGGGWEATALIEDLAKALDGGQQYQLFVLSDFDPTGYDIARDFEQRAKTLGVNITDVQRIGIEPEQVSDHVRRQERFQVPVESASDREWLRTHGIDGQYGLEIEAIGGVGEGGQPLREIVVNAMRDHLRFRDRIEADERSAVANVPYWAVENYVEEVTEEFREALLEYATDEMDGIAGVERCYRTPSGGVGVSIDLDTIEDVDHEFLPEPLSEEDYVECAVNAPTDGDGSIDVVEPRFGDERDEMKDNIEEELTDGDLDAEELLGIDG